ncbi:hypothetical protein TrVE_jg5955 [Triparma verrucosa]|uniref:cGMP-dependent protein kinase n=1 Tax=Triparma verrucosa TaxID=1606542 RepID=A0A9W7BHP2_9STRA|nr:hypothetical protein TrVE_jg5955 [Triparma verrucosa]
MGSGASSAPVDHGPESFKEFSYYRKEFAQAKGKKTNLELFEEIENKTRTKDSKLGKRGTMNDITYVRQGSNDSVPRSPAVGGKVLGFMDSPNQKDGGIQKYNSALGVSQAVETRRRAQVWDVNDKSKSTRKIRNFMKQTKAPGHFAERASKDTQRKDAASIVMSAFRKFFFVGSDIFDHMPLVFDAIEPVKVEAGETLIQKGEEGDKMYVIMSGILEVLQEDEKTVKVSLFHGDLVGEVALVYNEKRMATVRVKESGMLFSLSRSAYRDLQALASTASTVKRCTWLHQVLALSEIGYFATSRVVQTCCEVKTYPPKAEIMKKGENYDFCVLVEEGELTVVAGDDEGEEARKYFHGGEGEGGRCKARAGSFIGDGKLKYIAGLRSGWHNGICPVTVQNDSDKDVTCVILNIEDVAQCMGDEFKGMIVDETTVSSVAKKSVVAKKQYTLEDFEPQLFLGQGSFGSVQLVKAKEEEGDGFPEFYALKILSKKFIAECGQVEHTLQERHLVLKMNHPLVIKMYSTFQNEKSLFFLSEYIAGCDLWAVIHDDASKLGLRGGGLPKDVVKFYAASIVEGMGHIHSHCVAFRDLKPENIMVSGSGSLKIIDFGFAKTIPYFLESEDGQRQFMPKSHTMCGTPEYLSPEFITSEGHDHTCDLWSIGVVLHELVTSSSPFAKGNMTQLFTAIVTTMYTGIKFGENFDRKADEGMAKLIQGLCQFRPTMRLGSGHNGMREVKEHEYFKGFDWEELVAGTMPSPWKPDPEEMGAWREEEEKREQEPFEGDQEIFIGFGFGGGRSEADDSKVEAEGKGGE